VGNPGRDGPAPKSGAPRSPRPTPLAEILHDRLAAHAYPCTREAVRQCADHLLAAAREAVAACPWLCPAQAAASADEITGTALVLAVLAERQAGPKRIALGDARPPQVRRLCKACRTAAALIKAAAAGLGWSAADLAADSSRFESAATAAAWPGGPTGSAPAWPPGRPTGGGRTMTSDRTPEKCLRRRGPPFTPSWQDP
jgi:hypothetical protein